MQRGSPSTSPGRHRCGLIVNELVTNSLKYAFPQEIARDLDARKEPCTIGIHLVKEKGMYLLRVCDNGAGLPGIRSRKNQDSRLKTRELPRKAPAPGKAGSQHEKGHGVRVPV